MDGLNRREFLGKGAGAVGGLALGAALPGSLPVGGAEGQPGQERAAGQPAGGAADAAGQAARDQSLPRRVLGRTGLEITVLGLGTAPMGEGPPGVEECARVFAEAIDLGIRYVDTARIYTKGQGKPGAEDALGEVLRTRRDKVVLATKCMCDDRQEAERSFEESLRRLKLEAVDILHLHSTGDRDLDRVLAPGGVWDFFREQKKAGRARFLGITGHNRPQKFIRMLETGEVDVMMVAMNFADRYTYGFEDKVLPVARKHRTGILAMKVYGGIRGGFAQVRQRRPSQMDEVYLQNAVRYALEIEGVSGLVIGVHDVEEVRQNIAFVKAYSPLSPREREALLRHGQRLAADWGPRWGPIEA